MTLKDQTFSKIIIVFIGASLFCGFLIYKSWKENSVFKSDSGFYYGYLPAAFTYHDFSLKFISRGMTPPGLIYPDSTPNKVPFFKMSCGLAIIYSPFFLMGHIAANALHYATNGFSYPYEIFISLSCIFYVLLGVVFLKKLLSLRFDDLTTGITLLCITLGTNLFYYSIEEVGMSHAYSFSLISIFLFMIYKWNQSPVYKNSIALGILYGLISLIRPTNALVIFLFIFYNVNSLSTFKEKIISVARLYPQIIIMTACTFLIWAPQFVYWKYISGHWIFYSYQNEKFFWTKPHLIDGLIGYRKGWLLYTPLMVISILGLFFLRRKFPEFFTPIIVFLPLIIYVLLCWWCWWYGGSFGQRSFIDFYGIWAIPLASLISTALARNRVLKRSFLLIIILLISYNLFETQQYKNMAIHYDSMTKEAYWNSFMKLHPSAAFNNLLKTPDYEHAKSIGMETE